MYINMDIVIKAYVHLGFDNKHYGVKMGITCRIWKIPEDFLNAVQIFFP